MTRSDNARRCLDGSSSFSTAAVTVCTLLLVAFAGVIALSAPTLASSSPPPTTSAAAAIGDDDLFPASQHQQQQQWSDDDEANLLSRSRRNVSIAAAAAAAATNVKTEAGKMAAGAKPKKSLGSRLKKKAKKALKRVRKFFGGDSDSAAADESKEDGGVHPFNLGLPQWDEPISATDEAACAAFFVLLTGDTQQQQQPKAEKKSLASTLKAALFGKKKPLHKLKAFVKTHAESLKYFVVYLSQKVPVAQQDALKAAYEAEGSPLQRALYAQRKRLAWMRRVTNYSGWAMPSVPRHMHERNYLGRQKVNELEDFFDQPQDVRAKASRGWLKRFMNEEHQKSPEAAFLRELYTVKYGDRAKFEAIVRKYAAALARFDEFVLRLDEHAREEVLSTLSNDAEMLDPFIEQIECMRGGNTNDFIRRIENSAPKDHLHRCYGADAAENERSGQGPRMLPVDEKLIELLKIARFGSSNTKNALRDFFKRHNYNDTAGFSVRVGNSGSAKRAEVLQLLQTPSVGAALRGADAVYEGQTPEGTGRENSPQSFFDFVSCVRRTFVQYENHPHFNKHHNPATFHKGQAQQHQHPAAATDAATQHPQLQPQQQPQQSQQQLQPSSALLPSSSHQRSGVMA